MKAIASAHPPFFFFPILISSCFILFPNVVNEAYLAFRLDDTDIFPELLV